MTVFGENNTRGQLLRQLPPLFFMGGHGMAEKEMRFVKKIRGVRYVVRVKAADHARESYDSKLRKIIAEEMEQAKPTRRATKKG